MKKNYKKMLLNAPLRGCLLLMFALLAGLNASADDIQVQEMQLGVEYSGTMRDDAYFTFNPTEDGQLVVTGTGCVPTPYTDATFEETLDGSLWFSGYSGGKQEMILDVKKGNTYYMCIRYQVVDWAFTANMKDNSVINVVSVSPEAGKEFPLSDGGFTLITFDTFVEVASAVLQTGTTSAEVNCMVYGKEASLELKTTLFSWLKTGTMKAGDTFTLTLDGVRSAANPDVLYNGDGKLVLTYTASSKPAEVVSVSAPEKFLSYWPADAEDGVLSVQYDANLSVKNKLTATISFGSRETEGDFYQEILPVTIKGNTLSVDFRGKMRTPGNMVASGYNYGLFTIKINNICSADDKEVYSDVQGANGSYQQQFTYELVSHDLTTEFIPASGASLENESNIELWLSNAEAVTFDGVSVSFTDAAGAEQLLTYTLEQCGYKNEGEDGIILNIPVTEAMQTGKNVTVTLTNLTSTDGVEREISAVYNEVVTLNYTSVDPEVGSALSALEMVTLVFGEQVSVNAEVANPVVVTNRMGATFAEGSTLQTVMGSRGRAVAVNLSETLTEAGVYTIKIAAGAIVANGGVVNEDIYLMYEVTGGQPAGITFSPEDGAEVESLKEIIVSYPGGCHPSWNGVAQLLDAEGNVVATAEAGDYIPADKQADYDNWLWEPESALLTLSEEITKSGTYTLSLPAGFLVCGSNYDFSEEATATYIVVGAPALEYISVDPEVGSALSALEMVTVIFGEQVSVNAEVENPVVVTNRMGATFAEGSTLQSVMASRGRAVAVNLSETLTEAGVYTIKIAAGAIVANSGAVNEDIYLMYEVVGETAGFTFSPEDGAEVESLKEIIVSYPGGCHPSWNGVAQLLDAEGNVVATAEAGDYIPADKQADYDNWLWEPESTLLTLSEEITAPGTYTLNLPAGFLVCGSNYDFSEEATATYTVVSPKLMYASVDPESRSTVTTLEMLTLVFDEQVSINTEVKNAVIVTSLKGEVVAAGSTLQSVMASRGRAVAVNLSQPITEAGMYTVRIAPGAIVNNSGLANEAYFLTYKVTGLNETGFVFTPEDGAEVESLKEIIVAHEGGCHPSWNGVAQLLDADGNVVATAEINDYIPADKQEDYDNWIWAPESSILTLDKAITTPGTYTLQMPEGYFVYGENYGNSPALTVTYVVKGGTGIESIIGGSESYAVYNLNGVRLMQTTNKADLQTLKPGMYIINGKKVLVGK